MNERYEALIGSRARVISVIETTLTLRGVSERAQTEGELARLVTQYWSLDGQLLAEVDPAPGDTIQP
ncbi:MAG TPA: hypothetical protein VGA20_04470 [Gemmatimonadales bacterium]